MALSSFVYEARKGGGSPLKGRSVGEGTLRGQFSSKQKRRRRERLRKEVVSPFGFVISRNICGYQLTASYRSIIFDSISFS